MGRATPTQLALPMEPTEPVARWHAPAQPGELEQLRRQLPDAVHFATCGWTHPGWHGIAWSGPRTTAELEQRGLVEYAAHPLFTAVCLEHDQEEYADARQLRIWASQLPPEMGCLMEVHPEVTTPRFRHQDRSIARGRAGQVNRHFLDGPFFVHEILEPYQNAFGERLGRFLFTFPPGLRRAGISPAAFAERLRRFLGDIPGEVSCAVELREPQLLTAAYAGVLAAHGVNHMLTTWPGMPPLATQARSVPGCGEIIIRLVDGSGRRGRRARLEPFDQIRAANPGMRRAVVDLVLARCDRPTTVLVHNDAEGCAPLTILALARMLVDQTTRG